jgi:hypothetical protein
MSELVVYEALLAAYEEAAGSAPDSTSDVVLLDVAAYIASSRLGSDGIIRELGFLAKVLEKAADRLEKPTPAAPG